MQGGAVGGHIVVGAVVRGGQSDEVGGSVVGGGQQPGAGGEVAFQAVGAGFQMEHLPYIHGSGKIVLGDHVSFGGKPAFIFGNRGDGVPEVVIGDHTFIGHHTSLVVSSSVRVGKHCLIAGDVRISDYDGHPIDAECRRAGEPAPVDSIRPVVIGDDVWIGNNALILKGVHIGDRSIVGAGAVVTRDVPPDVVVAGNPARVVKQLVESRLRIVE